MLLLPAVAALLLTSCAGDPTDPGVAPPSVSSSPQDPAALEAGDVEAWLDGIVPAALDREGIAGASVAVVHDGAVVAERGYGLADTGISGGGERPVDPDSTLFRIGSISKTITATAVLQLVEDGELELDAPVADHLDFDLPVRFDRPITLRHLLSHTAGFEDQIAGVIGDPDRPAPSLRDAVALDPPEQIFEPGTVPAYSNYSNALAGYVVQRASGLDYARYVDERILTPLGMRSASLAQPLPPALRERMSKGYDHAASPEVPFEMVGPAPAGALSATASDMSAFLLGQLGHRPAGEALLSEASLALLHEPALDADSLGGLAAGPRMTLGFFEQDRNGHRILGHAGDLTAFHAEMHLYPDDDTGIYVALNSTGVRGDSTLALREQLLNGFADRYFPDARAAPEVFATAEAHAQAIAGSYLVSRHSDSTFARLFFLVSPVGIEAGPEGVITVSAIADPSGALLEFQEVEPWVWQEVGGQRRIAVDEVDGEVRAVGLNAAFTLLPMTFPEAAVGPVAAASVLVLLLALILAPVGAIARWRYGMRVDRDRVERRLRRALRGAQVALVLAGVCWAVVATSLLDDQPPPPVLIIRAAQVLTALAALGAIPAAWLALLMARGRRDIPVRRRVPDALGFGLQAVASIGLAYAAVVGGMLAPSITY